MGNTSSGNLQAKILLCISLNDMIIIHYEKEDMCCYYICMCILCIFHHLCVFCVYFTMYVCFVYILPFMCILCIFHHICVFCVYFTMYVRVSTHPGKLEKHKNFISSPPRWESPLKIKKTAKTGRNLWNLSTVGH